MARGHKADGVWASLRMLLGKGLLTLANKEKKKMAVSRMLTVQQGRWCRLTG